MKETFTNYYFNKLYGLYSFIRRNIMLYSLQYIDVKTKQKEKAVSHVFFVLQFRAKSK